MHFGATTWQKKWTRDGTVRGSVPGFFYACIPLPIPRVTLGPPPLHACLVAVNALMASFSWLILEYKARIPLLEPPNVTSFEPRALRWAYEKLMRWPTHRREKTRKVIRRLSHRSIRPCSILCCIFVSNCKLTMSEFLIKYISMIQNYASRGRCTTILSHQTWQLEIGTTQSCFSFHILCALLSVGRIIST